jgi:hypothetical protein
MRGDDGIVVTVVLGEAVRVPTINVDTVYPCPTLPTLDVWTLVPLTCDLTYMLLSS